MHTDSFSQVSLLSARSHKIFSKSHKQHSSINNSASLYPAKNIFSATLIDKVTRLISYAGMTISDIRKAKLEALISEYGSLRALAEKLEHSATAQISQWRQSSPDSRTGKPRTISNRSARYIELKCGKPVGWMDAAAETAQSKAVDDFRLALELADDSERSILLSTVSTIINTHQKDQRTTELSVIKDRRKEA